MRCKKVKLSDILIVLFVFEPSALSLQRNSFAYGRVS